MEKIEIKSRFGEKVLFQTEADALKIAVEIAVKQGADLEDANLKDANLEDANLRGAYLWGANLENANLGGANLWGAYLGGANLRGAYLWGAYLGGANLWGANLENANLEDADLEDADLEDADLGGAYLWGAYLQGADLRGADLNVKIPPINSHQFASEILWRNSKTENQKNFSARIRMELNLCWEDFYKLAKKMKVVKWAEKTLSKWDEYKKKIDKIKSNNP